MGRWTAGWNTKKVKVKYAKPGRDLKKVEFSEEVLEYEKAKLALEQELSEDDGKRNNEKRQIRAKQKSKAQENKIEKELQDIRQEKKRLKEASFTAGDETSDVAEQVKTLVRALNGLREKTGHFFTDTMSAPDIETTEETSIVERADAGSELWHLAFRGISYVQVIAHSGATEACMNVLNDYENLSSDVQNPDVLRLLSEVLAIVKCLCEINESLERMIVRGISMNLISLLRNRQASSVWSFCLQILSIISELDKAERDAVLKTEIHSLLLGDAKVRGSYSMLQDGREHYSIPALHFIELSLTKDSIRTKLLRNTNILEILQQIFECANLDTQGVACRIISRLCQSTSCRESLRVAGIHYIVLNYLSNAFSSINIGAAGVALAAISDHADKDIALQFIPHACKMLSSVADGTAKQDSAFNTLALAGMLRATCAFAEITEIQRLLVKHVPVIISIMAKEDSPETVKADSALILGSIATDSNFHPSMMDLNPNPLGTLLTLIRTGTREQQTSAARAIQHLSSNPDVRPQISLYTYRERVMVDKSTLKESTIVWDVLDAAASLLSKGNKARQYGVGIIQNLGCLDDFRKKIVQKLKVDESLVQLLVEICSKDESLCSRLMGVTAIGNLCKDKDMALLLSKRVLIRSVASLLFVPAADEKNPRTPTSAECQQASVRTLGLLAHNEDAVLQMLGCRFLDAVVQLLTSRSRDSCLTAAKSIRNITCFPAFMQFTEHPCLLPTIFQVLLRHKKGDGIGENLVAAIANLGLEGKNIQFLITTVSCPALVNLCSRGNSNEKLYATLLMRSAASAFDGAVQRLLVESGAISALVQCLNVSMDIPGGAAENSAGALARLAAGDPKYCAFCMEHHCIEPLLLLLSCGCGSARIQACKVLIIIAENNDFCCVIKLQGGHGVARRVLTVLENSDDDEALSRLVKILLDMVSTVSVKEQKSTSMVERQIAANMVVLKTKAEAFRNQSALKSINVNHVSTAAKQQKLEDEGLSNAKRHSVELKFPEINKTYRTSLAPDLAIHGIRDIDKGRKVTFDSSFEHIKALKHC